MTKALLLLLPVALLAAPADDELDWPVYTLPEPIPVEHADAADAEDMHAYVEAIPGSSATFGMAPIPGGRFWMGSPEDEEDREDWEGPRRHVEVSPFWMGTHEVTWDEYMVFMAKLDLEARNQGRAEATAQDPSADAVSRPTPPYVPMDFDMGTDGYPAICMTQFAAKQYTKWLSMKTGRFYRLPTEAEWEYACRAGTDTAFSFGDDLDALEEHAWFFDNSDDRYQPVGSLAPNPWGLHDMHGNVAEWTLDAWSKQGYPEWTEEDGVLVDPIVWPEKEFPRCVRGGSWDDDPEALRSAARRGSSRSWKVRDPQIPRSIWYHTDAQFLGFRIVRPLVEPSDEEKARYWDADLASVREILAEEQ